MNAQSSASRDIVVRRLTEDLLGPRSSDETLTAKPSDVYVTGILWPQNTPLPAEEDERLAVAPDGDESGDETSDQSQAAAMRMRRPSTAGVSFAAGPAGNDDIPIIVCFSFGLYHPEERDATAPVWVRKQIDGERTIRLTPGVLNEPLDEAGFPGVRLNVNVARFDNGLLATITLVNASSTSEPDRSALEQLTLFQTALEIRPMNGASLIARPSRRAVIDDEDRSVALLYRNAREFASGHTCSADWMTSEEENGPVIASVRTT